MDREVTFMDESSYYMKRAIWQELQEALELKKTNEELLEYLGSSLRWLLHYSKKYHISLPEGDKITQIIDRTLEITNKIPNTKFSPKTEHPSTTPDDSTEPKNFS